MSERFIKLVRDNVGDPNDEVVYKRAPMDDINFHWALKRKLIEEAIEYLEFGKWEELIDVFEVVLALCAHHEHDFSKLASDTNRKSRKSGSFAGRMSMWIRRPGKNG